MPDATQEESTRAILDTCRAKVKGLVGGYSWINTILISVLEESDDFRLPMGKYAVISGSRRGKFATFRASVLIEALTGLPAHVTGLDHLTEERTGLVLWIPKTVV